MNRVPVRALRNQTAEVLNRVKAGEIVELTEHGRPIARIVPLTLDMWEHLKLLGEVESAEENDGTEIADIAPAKGAPGVAPPSEILARLRAGER
jgi:prevent-host-death family protein